MKKIFISAFAASMLLFTYSCNSDFENDVTEIAVSKGNADFTKYVALGNSLTSGYRDGALYIDGQNESYPNMIAAQMKLAGGGEFKQPLMADNLGGIPGVLANKLVLAVDASGSLGPVVAGGSGTTTLASIYGSGPYQNMGVPGAKSFHLVADGYGNAAGVKDGKANPYFVRFASSGTTSVLKDAIAQKPTFFSLWIGNNDVLSYATSGGSGKDQTGNMNPATYGGNDITDPKVYASVIKSILDGMKAAGATKGVLANIPNVTSIPFFTTVPAKPIAGLTDAQVTALNTAYAKYNGGLALAKAAGAIKDAEYQQRLIKFTGGAVANGAVIEDKDLTDLSALGLPSYRQTTSADFILLTTAAALKTGGGTQTPLTNAQVLTEKETSRVLTATAAYNASLSQLAAAYGLALVDANSKMVQLSAASGLQFDGVKYNTTFVTGGAFSLDGVHLTGRGYAVIANEFISAINSTYGSNLPKVEVNKYSGATFP